MRPFLVALIAVCSLACSSADDPAPLAPASLGPDSVAPERDLVEVAPVALTFDPRADDAAPVEAAVRIDATEDPEPVVTYEDRTYLLRVAFPDDVTLDDVVRFEFGTSSYEAVEGGSPRLVPGETVGFVDVARTGRQTQRGVMTLVVPVPMEPEADLEAEPDGGAEPASEDDSGSEVSNDPDVHHDEAADVEDPLPVRVWARPVTLGWQQRRFWSPEQDKEDLDPVVRRDLGRFRLPEDGRRVIEAAPRRGTTITGLVLDPEGAPATSGQVFLRRKRSRNRWRSDRRAGIASDGRFTLHVNRARTYVLRATVQGVGQGELEPMEIALDDPPREVVIQLVGPGTIAGIVRDQHGLAVPGLPLQLKRRGDLKEVPEVEVEEGEDPPAPIDQSTGLTTLSVTTDDEGRFTAKGLRPGTYSVYERVVKDNDTRLLESGVQTTWEDPIELTVTATRVLVSCYEPGSGEALAWCPRGEVVEGREVLQAIVRKPRGEKRGHFRWRRTEQAHTWALWVHPGRSYRILIGSTERKFVERTVLVNPGQDRYEVALTLAPRLESATLRVFATDPPTTNHVIGHYATAFNLEATTQVASARSNELGGPMEMTIPPGSYRVSVHPQSDNGWWNDMDDDNVDPKPAVEVVDLAPGAVVDLHVETGAAGAVQILTALPAMPDFDWRGRPRGHPLIQVQATCSDGRSRSLVIETYVGWYYREWGRARQISPSGTLGSLEPGRWHVEMTLEGHEPHEVWVEVTHGKTTRLRHRWKRETAEADPASATPR